MWIGLKAEKSIYCTLFLRHSLKKTDQQLANHTSGKRLTNNWLTITLVASFWDDPCPSMGL